MAENIVQQIEDIEAEADLIVTRAKESAAHLAKSLESETAALRMEREAVLRDRVSALKQELELETAAKLDAIEQDAKKLAARLESLDEEAVSRALELIQDRLRENEACQ